MKIKRIVQVDLVAIPNAATVKSFFCCQRIAIAFIFTSRSVENILRELIYRKKEKQGSNKEMAQGLQVLGLTCLAQDKKDITDKR